MSYQVGNVVITEPWVRLIDFSKKLGYGQITVDVVNGQPTILVSAKAHIRFDRPETMATTMMGFTLGDATG